VNAGSVESRTDDADLSLSCNQKQAQSFNDQQTVTTATGLTLNLFFFLLLPVAMGRKRSSAFERTGTGAEDGDEGKENLSKLPQALMRFFLYYAVFAAISIK
jgi:hypothetical protein